jgi:hypothetical protein
MPETRSSATDHVMSQTSLNKGQRQMDSVLKSWGFRTSRDPFQQNSSQGLEANKGQKSTPLREVVCPGTSLEKEPPRVCPLERDDSSLNQGFALLDECDHIVSGLMDHSVIAAFHLRHRPCSDESSELCLEAEVLNPTIGTFFSMDAIHGKVGLPNLVVSHSPELSCYTRHSE